MEKMMSKPWDFQVPNFHNQWDVLFPLVPQQGVHVS
jgi:hypothetical protein